MAEYLEALFWSAAGLNLLIAAVLAGVFWRLQRIGRLSIADAKTRYSMFYAPLGLFAALFWFFGWVAVLDLSTGHGEVVLAAPALNLMLCAVATGVGRVVIGWRPLRW